MMETMAKERGGSTFATDERCVANIFFLLIDLNAGHAVSVLTMAS